MHVTIPFVELISSRFGSRVRCWSASQRTWCWARYAGSQNGWKSSVHLFPDQFRYIKIQPNTIDHSTRLWGTNPTNSVVVLHRPRTEVHFRMNFNTSKLVYWFLFNEMPLMRLFICKHFCTQLKEQTGSCCRGY